MVDQVGKEKACGRALAETRLSHPDPFRTLLPIDQQGQLPSLVRQLRRRGSILAQTRRLLAEGGYGGFSLRQVSERSEVTAQTIYNSFGTKQELLIAALNEYNAAVYGRVKQEDEGLLAFLGVNAKFYESALTAPDFMREYICSLYVAGDVKGGVYRHSRKLISSIMLSVVNAGVLRSGVDADALGQTSFRVRASAMYSWAVGHIDHKELRSELLSSNAYLLLGALRPSPAKELEWFMESKAGQIYLSGPGAAVESSFS